MTAWRWSAARPVQHRIATERRAILASSSCSEQRIQKGVKLGIVESLFILNLPT